MVLNFSFLFDFNERLTGSIRVLIFNKFRAEICNFASNLNRWFAIVVFLQIKANFICLVH